MTGNANAFRLPRPVLVLLITVIALELIAPFCVRSYGVDGHWNLSFVKQFSWLFAAGELVPRWVPQGYSGFGASTFYFYPPLSLYLASIIRVATGIANEQVLFQLTGLVATIVSFFSAAFLFRQIAASKYQQWLGAALYAFGPMQIAELYSRSSLSTHVAYVFLPLICAGVLIQLEHSSKHGISGVLLLGVSAALTAFSSVPVAMLTAVAMIVTGFVIRERLTFAVLARLLAAGAIAIILYASQWTAILSAQSYSHLEDVIVQRPEYLISALIHGGALHAAYYVAVLYGSVVWMLLASRTDPNAVSPDIRKFIQAGVVLTGFIALLEIPGLTSWLWSNVPPFTIIQGIWRFYVLLMLFIAAFVAIANTKTLRRTAVQLTGITALSVVIPMILIIFDLHIFEHTEAHASDPSEYRPIVAGTYAQTIEHTERHRSDSFVLFSLPEKSEFEIDSLYSTASFVPFSLSISESQNVTFHRFQWPYWRLYLNGRATPTIADSIGRASLLLPPGRYAGQWRLERTALERVGLWVSGIAWSALLFFVAPLLLIVRYKKKPQSPATA